MTLFERWEQLAQVAQTPKAQQAFWDEYYSMERDNYDVILNEKRNDLTGKLSDIAQSFSMAPELFMGFLDGINTSLEESVVLETLEEDTDLNLKIDFEKLYFNMHDAKADWLYNLPGWEGILSVERRKEIVKDYRASKVAVVEKTPGRNDPCPCGSGKKYKQCCGRSA